MSQIMVHLCSSKSKMDVLVLSSYDFDCNPLNLFKTPIVFINNTVLDILLGIIRYLSVEVI